jgi:hypothetical protein
MEAFEIVRRYIADKTPVKSVSKIVNSVPRFFVVKKGYLEFVVSHRTSTSFEVSLACSMRTWPHKRTFDLYEPYSLITMMKWMESFDVNNTVTDFGKQRVLHGHDDST